MKHMSVVVHQLKKEREHVQKQLERIDTVLEAPGKCQLEWRGTHVRSRSPENQSGTERAMGEAEGSHTPKAHYFSSRPQENRSGAESAMGEG